MGIVEQEIGRPISDVFERFDRDPIAAASLGQVHRARLKGREVVVKVQRPGLKALFDIDLKNLRVSILSSVKTLKYEYTQNVRMCICVYVCMYVCRYQVS